ncbi:MAG: helix-turn-helix domain-containing protein [Gammaproteobacteria bacterium]
MFYLFGVFALVAVILKSVILAQVFTQNKLTSSFNIAALLLIGQNFFEFLGYTYLATESALTFPAVSALIICLCLLTPALLQFFATATNNLTGLWISMIYWAIGGVLSIALVMGYVITGVEQVGYTIISTPGQLYPVFQVYSLTGLPVALWILRKGCRHSDSIISMRSQCILRACLPMMAVSLGSVGLRMLGFNSSTAIVMPLASTWLLLVLMHDQRGDIMTLRLKWRRTWFLIREATRSALGSDEYKLQDFKDEMERQQLENIMRYCDYNLSEAGRILGVSHTTISRKCKHYGINKRPEDLTDDSRDHAQPVDIESI